MVFKIESETSFPLSIISLTSFDKSEFSDNLSLKISPVERCVIENFSEINFAWVPFPAPGGPKKSESQLNSALKFCFF